MFGFTLFFLVIPLGFSVLIWFQYQSLKPAEAPDLPPLKIGMFALLSATLIWASVFLWLAVTNRNGGATLFGSPLSIPLLGVISWILCIAALICTFLRRKQAVKSRRLRNRIRLSSAFLMLIWLLFLLDVH